ncbi:MULTISPECIES: ATP-grasp fold amidoligase family protein [unclassified Sphingopyxis]|uniref:ATP-grasp fold amidoligase family protein n=1 Tax=unclassified Sphingopyxis TaxID=2614943 RepID=UPI0009EBCE3B|nr:MULTISPECIES: ATP-grasp fold amidoligase family protein [unclassified Sphingopyxis]
MTAAVAPAPTDFGPDRVFPLAAQRVGLLYAWRHGRRVAWDHPARFTELVQLRKLTDRSPIQTQMMDKIAAKRLAGARLGEEWIVPTIWQGTALPRLILFPVPAIIKSRHGCNQYRVVTAVPDCERWQQLRRIARRWQRRPYGRWLDEWAYHDVPRGILAEPLLGGALPLPIDYKIYVFGGVATHVQVHLGRGRRHRWILHDRSWRQLVRAADEPPPPPSLAAMLEAAEALAGDMNFLRVDFYDVGGRPYFGEYCLYPGSGLDPFAADWIDFELGALWLSAMARNAAPSDPLKFVTEQPCRGPVVAPSSAMIGIETAFEEFHAIDDREKEGR